MSSHKTRIARIEKLFSGFGKNWRSKVARFQEAFARGMVFCKDGKERTVEEWLKTLDADTTTKLSNLGITSRPQGSETQE